MESRFFRSRTLVAGWRIRARSCRPVLAAVVAHALLGIAILAQAPAPSERTRLDAAARRTTERLRTLQREADALAAQERTLLVELRKLEVDRQIAVETL